MGLGGLRRLDHVPLARFRPSEEDVVADGRRKQGRFLQHNADLGAQGGQGDVPDVPAVEQNPAAGGIIKAGNETDDGRLA